MDLKTSYVMVQQVSSVKTYHFTFNLKTSYVMVQRNAVYINALTILKFKNILCYGSAIFSRLN